MRAGDLICAADGAAIGQHCRAECRSGESAAEGASVLPCCGTGETAVSRAAAPGCQDGEVEDRRAHPRYAVGDRHDHIYRKRVPSLRRFGARDRRGGIPDMAGAKVFACSVIGVNKGTRGRAGELKGLFHHETTIARAELFCGTGLFGTFESGYDLSACRTAEIAPASEAVIGKAVIYSTVDGREPKPYEIAIAKVDANDRDNKNFVIKVTGRGAHRGDGRHRAGNERQPHSAERKAHRCGDARLFERSHAGVRHLHRAHDDGGARAPLNRRYFSGNCANWMYEKMDDRGGGACAGGAGLPGKCS